MALAPPSADSSGTSSPASSTITSTTSRTSKAIASSVARARCARVVPRDALPELVPNWGEIATTDPSTFLDLELPIAGIAGDQQAALFGQACYSPGMSKCTYGTGSFVLTNTGPDVVRSDAGLLTTVAWDLGDGLVYALEGSIFVTGAAVQWLRDGLGLIDSANEVEGLARTVPDSGDVVFVPALTGMGANLSTPDGTRRAGDP